MLRKLKITESERKEILSIFNQILNEEEQYATLEGKVYHKGKIVPNSQVKLFQDGKLIKGATSDENGLYKITDIPLGTYKLVLTNKVEGFQDYEDEMEFKSAQTYRINLSFREDQTTQETVVKMSIKRLTIIDVQVLDVDNKPLGPCKIEIFDKDGNSVPFTPNKTDGNGVLELISIDGESNPNFKSKTEGKPWESETSIVLKATYGNVSNQKEYKITLNNGILGKEGGSDSISRVYVKNEEGDVLVDLRKTNILKINIQAVLNYRISVNDDETGKVLENAVVSLYGDKERINLIKQGNVPLVGSLKREKLEDSGYENTYTIYYTITNNGYEPKSGKLNISKNKDNNYDISLDKIVIKPPKPPKPEKPLSERACLRLTNKHYRNMNNVDAGNITIAELGGIAGIKQNAEEVKDCYLKFRKEYPNREQKIINRLLNVQADLDFFEIKLTKQQVRDIYGESKTMSLKNTIRQVVSESVKIKNLSSEKNLVEQRLKFSLNGSSNLLESKRALRNERHRLINFGYDKELVRESFLDVMKGLYGNDGADIISDVKTRLGQRIADQVKNKQEEHEMILSAFNELPTEMIERAIKENRVDELSNEISTKALENYKTQFGTEGLSGIMIASIDENKFKQEVAKLIEPAIKDITTKMDEKLKQVQNAVSGGLNPTA